MCDFLCVDREQNTAVNCKTISFDALECVSEHKIHTTTSFTRAGDSFSSRNDHFCADLQP